MRLKPLAGYFLLLPVLLFLGACNVTKNLPPNEYLLIKNKFKINTSKVSSDDLSGYLQQTPNSKLFGLFRLNIAFYNMGSKGKDTKFKKWLRTKLGSAPVLLDTTLSSVAKKQMGLYLNNKGYFNSFVDDSIIYKKRKASVYYVIKTIKPYTIRNFVYNIPDKRLAGFINKDTSKCLVKKGNNFDSYALDDERTRITTYLMNQGFYRFSANFIAYRVDSALNTREMDITLEITNPVVPSIENFGTVMEIPHKQYVINKIYVYPDYDPLQSGPIEYDTLILKYRTRKNAKDSNTYYFLYRDRLKIKPRTLAQSIFIESKKNYVLNDVNQTYSQLSRLQVFRYTNIQFQESPEITKAYPDQLDARIYLSRSPLNSFSISTDGTNSAGAFGVQGNLTYQNRNIFRGAQLFNITFNASAQMQGSIGSTENTGLFNTLEFGLNAGLTFPQFLIPIRQERLSKYFKPRTTILAGYNYQLRPDYDRIIANTSFGYQWDQKDLIKHILNPIEILFVKVNPDSAFTAQLEAQTDKRLVNQYTDHMILGFKYTITFNNQHIDKYRDFFYVRSNFEMGGNLLYIIDEVFGAPRNDNGSYTLFDIQYAQFIRPDFDFRYYHLFGKNTKLVLRFYGGIGFAYGNSSVLPFEKAFYAGGANDIRGWKLGTLGPGSYHNDTLTDSYDQTGDMQLQVNAEYRFSVYKFFKSAVFLDAGNIWLLRSNPDYPGGQFNFNTFVNQVALSTGIGLRFDFNFFIFRLDPAFPIRVPYYPENNHWYLTKIQFSDIIWNFGIGYPF